MNIYNSKVNFQKILVCLGMVCGTLGVVSIESVSSQTTSLPVIRILRVTSNGGTTFKLRNNWYQQSPQIPNNQKCAIRQGEKFFISDIKYNTNSPEVYDFGNNRKEFLKDYYEVTFEKPVPCSQQDATRQTWFVFKKHAQILQANVIR